MEKFFHVPERMPPLMHFPHSRAPAWPTRPKRISQKKIITLSTRPCPGGEEEEGTVRHPNLPSHHDNLSNDILRLHCSRSQSPPSPQRRMLRGSTRPTVNQSTRTRPCPHSFLVFFFLFFLSTFIDLTVTRCPATYL
jgi:hypothetical protein